MKLIKAMATVAGLTMVSRGAGFVRDVLTAAILGAGSIADAFFVALKLPNFFRRVTAEGAFSVSFVPLYSKKLEGENGQEAADAFASDALSCLAVALSIFTLLMMMSMPLVVMGIAPGFEQEGARFDLAVDLSRITFPYLFLISMTALLGGILNAHGRYGPFAAAPILFNLSLITALLVGRHYTPTVGHALAWGIFVAGVLQLLFMIFFTLRENIHLKIKKPQVSGDVKRLLMLMGPGVIGAGVVHINLFADMIIASFLPTGSISYLYYADRLNQLPLGVVGIAVGTALLPLLSKALISEDKSEANGLFNRALEYCFLLALPATAALIIIPDVLIKVLFERGAFDANDAAVTAMVLRCYAIGLPAYIAVKVFSTVYWANEDTVSPVKVSVKVTLLNIILALILSRFMGVVGIALATGGVAWLQFILLKRGLKDKEEAHLDPRFKRHFIKIVFSTCLMGAVLVMVKILCGDILDHGTSLQTFMALVALILSGLVTYAIAVIATGILSPQHFKTLFTKKKS